MDRSNRFRRPPASDPVGAVRSSIANRLNASLFLRQLGFFLLLDLVLGAILLCGVVFYAENRCADVAALVEQRGVPTADTLVWMQASDYTIAPLDRAPEGRTVPCLPVRSWPAPCAAGIWGHTTGRSCTTPIRPMPSP